MVIRLRPSRLDKVDQRYASVVFARAIKCELLPVASQLTQSLLLLQIVNVYTVVVYRMSGEASVVRAAQRWWNAVINSTVALTTFVCERRKREITETAFT